MLRTLRRHEARIDPDRTDTDDATVAVLRPHPWAGATAVGLAAETFDGPPTG